MALTSSIEPQGVQNSDGALLARHGAALLDLARGSIAWHASKGARFPLELTDYPPELRVPRAVFVTLSQDGALRGCVGSALAWRPLVKDVADNAVAAAVEDHRFAPLAAAEVESVRIALSLLSVPVRIEALSEADLAAGLRPGLDGLILRDGKHSALFLPQVWHHLPEAGAFLAELRAKAGLARDHWSPTLEFRRFAVTEVAEPGATH